jgi:hypothetical protein
VLSATPPQGTLGLRVVEHLDLAVQIRHSSSAKHRPCQLERFSTWQDATTVFRARLLIAVATFACQAGKSAPNAAPSEPRLAETRGSNGVDAPSESSAQVTEPAPNAVREPASFPFAFSRVEAAAVTSLGVGKPPKIALLTAGEALLFDGAAFRRLAAPETTDPALSVEIFFGRDDQPRLMGYRRPDGGSRAFTPFYRRFKGGRFQPELGELGPLGGPDGALYGVLGHDDPEVVCRPSAFCLVKRTTGWGRANAHVEPVRVLLAGGTAWALHRDRIERLERDTWVSLAPERAWELPTSVFVDQDGSPWIVEAKRGVVTRLVNGRWETQSTPVSGARAIWGRASNDVWLVGVGGAAHFDGQAWFVAPGVAGPLSFVAYSRPNLWLAGEAGVYRGSPVKPD